MAKNRRNGQREKRFNRKPKRHLKLGYYSILTDTDETEKNYFEGLKKSLKEEYGDKIAINVNKENTDKLVESALNINPYDVHSRERWIVFDRDEVQNFDTIIDEAERNGIRVGWSNPCFEIWLHAYYGKMPSSINSQQCCRKFASDYKKKTNKQYKKSDKNLYRNLVKDGDEEKAIKLAKQKHKAFQKDGYKKASEMSPCTTVYELVTDIKEKVEP